MIARRRDARLALAALAALAAASCRAADEQGAAPPPGAVPAACQADEPHARPRLRRLTRDEFDNTVRDLLGVPSEWGATFPPDDVVAGFNNNGGALRVGPLLADKLFGAAEAIGAAATRDLDKLVPCPGNQRDAACAHAFISTLGRRAFRRPMSAGELERHLRLYDTVAAGEGFASGLGAVIAALVQSPSFLYRTELGAPGASGPTVALTDHEIASELSYLFWATMPDAELFAAADAGALHTREQIAAQARRLLASPRSRAALDRFATQWLALDAVLTAPKDGARYPDFTPAVRAAMRRESLDLFDRVAHAAGGRLPELMTTRESILDPALARFYGLSGAPLETLADGRERWEVASAHRGGLLTHGSVLAAQAKPDSASPVHRGKLVRERLLCGLLPPPPAGFNLQLAPVDPNQQNRARFTQHAQNPTCASCHRLIDPIGFGFERYDAVGRYRESEAGQSIDDSGEIVAAPYSAGPFHGVVELEQRLAGSPELGECFARQWTRFAYGLSDGAESECIVQRASAALTGADLRIADLLVALTQAPDFTSRLPLGGAGPAPDLGGTTPSDGGGGPAPDLAAPPDLAQGELSATVNEDSRWPTGYCARVLVENRGARELAWSVELPVEGTINNLWNAVSAPAGAGRLRFSGAPYNLVLRPGESLTFGWCAMTI